MELVYLNMDKIYSDCVFVKDILLASRERKLHSVSSIQPSFVRFFNQTNCNARIFWLDYEGCRRFYDALNPGEFLDVNTFATHLWIFENGQSGDRLLGGGKYVFQAEPWFGKDSAGKIFEARKIIPISYPMYSLRSRALQVVRDNLSTEVDVDVLEIPKEVKLDLKYLVQKQQCFFKHEKSCQCTS